MKPMSNTEREDFAFKLRRARGLLIGAARRIADGREMYACEALAREALIHRLDDTATHYLASDALGLFENTPYDDSFMTKQDYETGRANGWFGRPTPTRQRIRVIALLLAAETLR